MADVATVPHSISDWHDSFFLLANDPAIQSLESIFAAIAGTHIPVLIVGEEGTGRSSAARAIHRMEFSGDDGLVEVAAAVVTEEMFAVWASTETTNTDALGVSPNGASPNTLTLVLEEVSELDAACQWRLAQMLAANGKVGCRVIATTRKNLELEAHGGRFREDVLYQLNRVCLSLPPLRYRKHDVVGFIDFFLTKYAILFHRSKPLLTTEVQAALVEHSWPGNLAELENTIRTIVATDDEQLALAALRRAPARRARGNGGNGETVSLKQASRAASRQAERELIAKALTRTQGNRKRAAVELKISYKALLYKLKENGITGLPKPERA